MNKFLSVLLFLLPAITLSMDSFDPVTGVINMPHVQVGTENFAVTMQHQGDLVFTVASAVPASNLSTSPDTYDAVTGVLTIPSITVGTDNFMVTMQHQGDLSFRVTAANPLGGSEGATFYAPAPISEVLQHNRVVSWTSLSSSPVNLTRFSMGAADSTGITVLTETNNAINAALSIDSTLAMEVSATNDRLLRSIFKSIEDSNNAFRIVSTKHSNYAIDVDLATNSLVVRDVRSGSINTASAGYLLFQFQAMGNGYILSATGRKTYSVGAQGFVDDPAWAARTVVVAGGALQLSSTANTIMRLYASPINLDVPFDLNPDNIARVSNPEVTPFVKGGNDAIATTPNDVVQTYRNQVTAAGLNPETTAAATAMLETIQTSLASQNLMMRYPAQFYLAFREGLLKRSVQSSDSTDGTLGQLTVPYVFFTNASDASGNSHPFMVITSYGLPDSLALLWDVARPPGDGLTGSYETQAVTRSFHRESFRIKIPLRDYGRVQNLIDNAMVNDLASDAGVTQFDHHNYASISAAGVAIDGVIIYPSYNNRLNFAHSAAELSVHGMHSGRGLGVHYHADAYSAKADGLNLYNASDYAGRSHPPIVSMGFDGIAGYGVYPPGDTSLVRREKVFQSFLG
ncbi:MAG: hypothetical protein AAF512_00900 [Pseudomonadota bacterium]